MNGRDRPESLIALACAVALLVVFLLSACDQRMEYIEELTNNQPSNKVRAAQALARYDDPETVKALLLVLNDSDRKLRYAALNSLREIFERNHGRDPSGVALTPLSKILMYDKEVKVRYVAMEVLGVTRDPRVDEIFMDVLGKASTPVSIRIGAAGFLGQRGCTRAEGVLVAALLRDPDPDVRKMAAWALGEVGSTEMAAEALEAMLQDYLPPGIKAIAREALEKVKGRISGPGASGAG